MMTVLGCITESHDLWLVLLAALVCIAGAWATIRLFTRAAAAAAGEKAAWIILTAVVAGTAIWCTHFIAMLGYDPGVPVAFDPVLTIVSLLVSVAGVAAGCTLAAGTFSRVPAVGGAVVGLAISAMHYSGMVAYRVQGLVSWDMSYLLASVLLSALISAAALQMALTPDLRHRSYFAAGLLVLAIISLHFTGMTAFRVEPLLIEGSYSNPEAMRALAFAVAGAAVVVVGAGFASHLIDISARTEASEALGNMSNGLLMVSGNSTIQLYNTRVLELFGLKRGQLSAGMPLSQYLFNVGQAVGWDQERTNRVIDNHKLWMGQTTTTRIEHHFDDGKILNIVCRPLDSGGAIITYDDVTEAREGQRTIAHMAFHDALTGLANRRSFAEQLAREAQQSSVTMLMIDLDRFKVVNDTLGHGTGDKLLVGVAQRLRKICRPADQLFRLGGDELAVLVKSTSDEALLLAQDIVSAMAMPFRIGEHRISVGCSIGVAAALEGTDPEVVQQMADLALYKAKENGRGRVEVYQSGMMEESSERHRVQADLSTAVEKGQLELYYQPLFELPSRALSGFEALLRWHHPERGMVPPAEFIPIAERNGSILEIGAWVIDQACRQAASWPADVYVSINVSPVQLRSADILWQITSALERHNLPPRRIEIEVTETAMVDNTGQIAAVLTGLRALGVRIAMDDFGTGYSSLAHLREFELDRIKIDRSFINSCHTDAGAAAVVRAVTSLAKDLAIDTTGEGVENEEQLANLISLGCQTAQGYLLGRPLDASSATKLMATERAQAYEGTLKLSA